MSNATPDALEALRAIDSVPAGPAQSALRDLRDNYLQALDALEALRKLAPRRQGLTIDELNNMEAETISLLENVTFLANLLTPDDEQDRNDAAIDRAMGEVA